MKTKEKELIINNQLIIRNIEGIKNTIINKLNKNNLEKLSINTEEIDLTGIQLLISIKKFIINNNKELKLEINNEIIKKLQLYGFEILV